MNVFNNRLVRYNAVVAKIVPPKGKKKEEVQAIQQQALDSWLLASSKVILLNRQEEIPYLKTNGVIFNEKYSSDTHVIHGLEVLASELPADGYGILLEDRVILDPRGANTLNKVRIDSQLSKAWACVAALDHEDHKTGELIGVGGAAFWLSKNVAKYICDTSKNPPFFTDYPEWSEWLEAQIKAKVFGHRFFDASAHSLGKVLGEESKPIAKPVMPFTKH